MMSVIIFEPGQIISYKIVCEPISLRMRSLTCLRCPHENVSDTCQSTVPCENSAQTARMRRLIWDFTGLTCKLVENTVLC